MSLIATPFLMTGLASLYLASEGFYKKAYNKYELDITMIYFL